MHQNLPHHNLPHQNLIDGQDVGVAYSTNINPSDTEDAIGTFARADVHDVDAAIDAARRSQAAWGDLSPSVRASALDDIGTRILAREEEFASMLAREEGKTIREARGEVRRAGTTFRYFAAQLMNPIGSIYQGSAQDSRVHTVRRPVGVIGIITPWNFPIAIPAWKIAPALAYGNAVVFKPADLVPGSAWMLAQVIRESAIPAGVFNLVMGRGSVVGQRMVESPHVDAITFTGSTAVGQGLAQDAARHGLKKLQLEMGGKNPLVVLNDADIDTAVAAALDGAFGSTGQRCTASSRLVVESGIHDEFVSRLTLAMSSITVGPALEESSTMGPAASESQLAQNLEYIQLGKDEGAELVSGGSRIDRLPEGYFIEPTLFVDGHNSMRINQEEIFGPIACVIRADDYDEALAVANAVDYGLSTGIITDSLSKASDFQRRAAAGMISINRSIAGTDYHAPFGGTKNSSYGTREQGQHAQEFFTTVSTVYSAGQQW